MDRKASRIWYLRIFLSILIPLLILNGCSTFYVICNPDDDPDNDCHSSGEYYIKTRSNLSLYLNRHQNFTVNIEGGGTGAILEFNILSVDNAKFIVYPTSKILDNSIYDKNITTNAIAINFTLTAPSNVGTFEILFYIRSPEGIHDGTGKPYIAHVLFIIIVENPTLFDFENFLSIFIDHYNIYLGSIALGCLIVGTILSEWNYRKYIKHHGILSATSLILSTLNLFTIIPETFEIFDFWFRTLFIDWWHLIHIIFGIIGFIACGYGALTGLSGIRHRISGCIALSTWGFNFIFGILYWGVGLV